MALNALGYTLSDRTTRYAEAKALIEQPQAQSGRPGVLDSLGWVNYRLGNRRSRTLAAQALERFPDQEVAHLGEAVSMANSAKPGKSGKSPQGTTLKAPFCAAPSSA
jgi:hypothetical protein